MWKLLYYSSVLFVISYEQITTSFVMKINSQDLSEDINYASQLVDVLANDCDFLAQYEEFYYIALQGEVGQQVAYIDEMLLQLQVNEESLNNLRTNYDQMLVDVRNITDMQQQNLANYKVFLIDTVDYDLYNDLIKLKVEDMIKFDEHYVKIQTDFNEAENAIRDINEQLFRETLSLVEGMYGPEYDAITSSLENILYLLNAEYSSIMHARLRFSDSKSNAEYALQNVVNQIPAV